MIHCYLELKDTNYNLIDNFKILWSLHNRNFVYPKPDTDRLLEIYKDYCRYKNFESFWPIYKEQFTEDKHEVLGYYDNDKLVAWSLIYLINDDVVECFQFAWDYKNPELKLGYKSLFNECALYKSRGYKTLLLGEADEYKKSLDGFKIFPAT